MKKVIAVILFFSLIIGGNFAYAKLNNKSSNETKNSSTGADDSNNSKPDQATTKQDETPAIRRAPALSDFSYLVDGGLVKISFFVDATEQGTCYYNFASEDTSAITETNPSTSAKDNLSLCKIEINQAKFTKLGDYKLTVSFVSPKSNASSTINVNVN